MSDNTQRSWIDIVLFGLAAVLPLLFIAALWYDSYPAISYINDLATPEDLDFNEGLWLFIPAIAGFLAFAFWGWNDVYATPMTSKAIAGFSALGLLYYLIVLVIGGPLVFREFDGIIPLPIGELSNLELEGFQAFLPIFFIFLFGVGQVFIKRDIAPRPEGEEPARFLNRVPFSALAIGLLVGNLVLFIVLANWGSILGTGDNALGFVFNPDRSAEREIVMCSDSYGCSIIHPLIYSAILLFLMLTGFAYTTLLERKLIAFFQQRIGPNRAGPGGFLQPVADGVKLIFKEDIMPSGAKKPVYYIAPMLKAAPTLIVLAVIPLGPDLIIPWFDGVWYQVPLAIADVGVGVLWLLAITSLGTYGVVLAGWASNNKYSMLGGLRASAQMVSYELSMGLALAVPVLLVGSMSVSEIVEAQGGFLLNWFIFLNPLAAGILFIALVAETNRAPFDLPEAEQELTAGYMTEYSGMKFALFMMAEYLGMIGVSMIAASMFLGGYQDGFGLVDSVPILGPLVMIGKVVLLLSGFIWLRATLPRLRYDRLMQLGWKIMLPLAIIAVIWTAVAVVVGDAMGTFGYLLVSGVMIAIIAVGYYLLVGQNERRDVEIEDDYENDPIITGERVGPGFMALQAVGGLLAIPFVLFDGLLGLLDRLAQFAPEPDEETPDDDGDDKALPAEASGD